MFIRILLKHKKKLKMHILKKSIVTTINNKSYIQQINILFIQKKIFFMYYSSIRYCSMPLSYNNYC